MNGTMPTPAILVLMWWRTTSPYSTASGSVWAPSCSKVWNRNGCLFCPLSIYSSVSPSLSLCLLCAVSKTHLLTATRVFIFTSAFFFTTLSFFLSVLLSFFYKTCLSGTSETKSSVTKDDIVIVTVRKVSDTCHTLTGWEGRHGGSCGGLFCFLINCG